MDDHALVLGCNGVEPLIGRVALVDDDDLARCLRSLEDRGDQLADEWLAIPGGDHD